MKKRSAEALALQLKIYQPKKVKAKKGKGAYDRKEKHKKSPQYFY
jgi:stalled ribosome alternative rescue factor ArfA